MPLIERIANAVSRKSRGRKFEQFLRLLKPEPADTILDVGVNNQEYSEADNYLERHYPYPEKITALAMGDLSLFRERYPRVSAVSGDGRNLPFENKSFAIGYSNAVIEHVGDTPAQVAFLMELYRVSKRGYLTTPNRLFPIEIHTRIPLLHLILSKKRFDACLSRMGKKWATGDYMHLLSERELRHILAEAGIEHYTLFKNRFLGMPMTFTIIWNS